MVQSMTGFASGQGATDDIQWIWDIRSVNAKGLDIRLRVPDWISGLEAEIKPMISKSIGRGSVSVSLRVSREHSESDLSINDNTLASVLAAMAQVEKSAIDIGLSLTPPTAADVLSVKGVMESGQESSDTAPVKKAVIAAFQPILKDFVAMRQQEGKALEGILQDQVSLIEDLTNAASDVVETRRADLEDAYRASLKRVVENADGIDADRISQEIALLAVKTDVTEELDRLVAHIAAARKLLAQGDKIGRKLDFLSQEFNREANTLCSKSQHKELTAIGLDLKAAIDQMREQVQNVE